MKNVISGLSCRQPIFLRRSDKNYEREKIDGLGSEIHRHRDFDCPTYEDQYGRFWKDLNLGKSEKPDLYSTTRNDLDGEPVSHIQQEYTFELEPFRRSPYEFQYMMLSRMQRDCEYFLGYGNRSVTILSESDPQHHINRMKELWKELPADGKPEWLTWEQLLNYEKELCNE